MYLKRSRKILIKMLSKIFNYTFKTKIEENYIYVRLDLFDQYYCLKLNLQLSESYLEIGLQQHLWPVSFTILKSSLNENESCFLFLFQKSKNRLYTMAKSNDFSICHQFLMNCIINLKKEIDQCQMKLNKQSQLCPIENLSLDQIDHYLNEFVDCQRKYLSIRNNHRLFKFKDNTNTKSLTESISNYHFTTSQVSINILFFDSSTFTYIPIYSFSLRMD